MSDALSNASYVGEFITESAERTERLSIVHRVSDGVVSERLASLSGNGRELVRENDEVVVYLPDQKLAIIERRAGRSDLMGSLPQFAGEKLVLTDPAGVEVATIANVPGTAGSFRVYAYLASRRSLRSRSARRPA